MKISRSVSLVLTLQVFQALTACESFLDIPQPTSKIPASEVFQNESSAQAAMVGIYLNLTTNGFARGGTQGINSLAGLSSDELINLSQDPNFSDFEYNMLGADNPNISSLWVSMYKGIYEANIMLEGLQVSRNISAVVKNQLRGEALFIRAFCHFYLINCFDDVALVITTDYKINAVISRFSVEEVYDQIEIDLLEAEGLLKENYENGVRARPIKYTATAMLARMYLYKKDWPRAEDKASNVINMASVYSLPSNLNSVFLANSNETIWQIVPNSGLSYTIEGYTFNPVRALQNSVLNESIIFTFESGDKRRADWIISVPSGSETYYLPYKYKLYQHNPDVTAEYSMVLRLAEQHLIRAEARAMQGKLIGPTGAEFDVNKIRSRAGLTALPEDEIDEVDEMLAVIDHERRVELFTEWGHRWFDLKRRAKAVAVLGPLKFGFTENDLLYPLPSDELRKNPNLKPQNPGY